MKNFFQKIKGAKNTKVLPIDGCLSDYKRAIELAQFFFKTQFEDSLVESQFPFNATLFKDSLWIIEGTTKNMYSGGELHIEFLKRDARVLTIKRLK